MLFDGYSVRHMTTTFDEAAGKCCRRWWTISAVTVLGMLAACSSTRLVSSGSLSDANGVDTGADVGSDGGDGSIDSNSCVVDLSALVNAKVCPASWEDVLASNPCQGYQANFPTLISNPAVVVCNSSLSYAYGHDGRMGCSYDPATHALIGGFTFGGGAFFSPSCPTTTAGATTSSCAADAGTNLCAVDGGSAADH